ncbi:MAG: hypothetical protein QOK07_3096 [Gemmatimonadaceae bacterium]|nr:hypothetical protein [Gemmatimonadaceae bacterium]
MNLPIRRPEDRSAKLTPYRQPGLSADSPWYEVEEPAWAYTREHEPVFSLSLVDARAMATFPFRAIRRHRLAASLVGVATLAVTALAAVVLPRHYIVETKILAQPNFVMPALNNPRRAIPSESDAPTRLAGEAVMKQDNLLEIIRETNLISPILTSRSPLAKVEDYVRTLTGHELSTKQRTDNVVRLLRNRMWVVGKDGTVTIGVDWTDPYTAYRITQTAQQNFFDQRHASEVAMISESVAILEGHVAETQAAIQEAVTQVNRSGAVIRRSAPARIPNAGAAAFSPNAAEIGSLQAALIARRQTISDLESARAQRIAALQNSLNELRNNYGPAHPQVVSTQESIRGLSSDSPQLTALRTEEASLRSRIVSLGGRPGEVSPQQASEPNLTRVALETLARPRPDSLEDPGVTYAKSRLKMATGDYEDMLQRLEAARIELQTARAAFKYRYTVVTPPQLPTRAAKPRVPLLLAEGCVLAVMLALFAGGVLDLGSGRLMERWQVTRRLHLPILAQAPLG